MPLGPKNDPERQDDPDRSEFATNIALIARVRDSRDIESWREFYEFYRPLLTRYLRRLGLNDQTANDMIQDVFVRLLQALPQFDLDRERGRFRSYLWKLCYNALIDHARHTKVRKRAEEEWITRFRHSDRADSEKLHEEWNQVHRQQVLKRALPAVQAVTSAKAWTCFEGRFLHDRPGSAIAADLGISDKAVFVYASRVLKAVRAQCDIIGEQQEAEAVGRLLRRK